MEKKDYHYQIYSPGGNETALVFASFENEIYIRKFLNDKIMARFSEKNKEKHGFIVEQVGFIENNLATPRLVMAGGEFCGNATRSAAWHYLKEAPGEINISVSGIIEPLKAGVKKVGERFEAWAQMPVYKKFDRIKEIKTGHYKVEIEGITHIVIVEEQSNDYLSCAKKEGDFEENLKEIASSLLEEFNLDNTAAGVIFLENTSDGLKIHPCVSIPGISCFYETACGSGTIAVGLVKCLLDRASIEVTLIQPSNQTVTAIVNYDGKEITYAAISGSVKTITDESIETIPKFEILQIKNIKEFDCLDDKYNAVELYKECFGSFPYCEDFKNDEIEKIFSEYCKYGILLFGVDPNSKRIMSFAAAKPLEREQPVLVILESKNIEYDKAKDWYHADIGVAFAYRKKGIGHLLGRKLLELIPAKRIFMRTHENNKASKELHERMSFIEIKNSLHESPSRKKRCGKEEYDKSILMQYKK
jgi:diaminopimelate epimerase/ribosomal protein S18 acetylase RimI-like enzyme